MVPCNSPFPPRSRVLFSSSDFGFGHRHLAGSDFPRSFWLPAWLNYSWGTTSPNFRCFFRSAALLLPYLHPTPRVCPVLLPRWRIRGEFRSSLGGVVCLDFRCDMAMAQLRDDRCFARPVRPFRWHYDVLVEKEAMKSSKRGQPIVWDDFDPSHGLTLFWGFRKTTSGKG
jgi:hypothetical protein